MIAGMTMADGGEIGMQEVKAHALLTNEVGLHARPSVKLTQLAKRFASTVEVAIAVDGPWTDAKSPVKIMRVKAAKGETLYMRANGTDAEEAVRALADLVNRKSDGEERGERRIEGRAASRGLAIGPAVVLRALEAASRSKGSIAEE